MNSELPNPDESATPKQHVSARVPESISRGVFSTGTIIMTGGSEFIMDFIQNVGRPHQVAARIVMPHGVMPQFIDALQKNIELFRQRFGDPPELPKPANTDQPKPTVQQIYDELKLPDDVLSGNYANGVMIGHTASEFRFDFLTNFYPNSAVSARIFLSAAQVPRLLESLSNTFQQFQQRVAKQREQQNPSGEQPPEEKPPEEKPPEEKPPEELNS